MKVKFRSLYARDLLIFFAVLLFAVWTNWSQHQSLYLESADGNLYFSIAENFLKTGHWLQSARPHEANMLVPPGLPLICLVSALLGGGYELAIAFQYILFALCGVFLSRAAAALLGKRSFLADVIIVYWFLKMVFMVPAVNPAYLLTETYTLFFLCLAAAVLLSPSLTTERKTTILTVALFIQYIIRPVAGLLWVISLCVMGILTIQKRFPVRKAVALAMSFVLFLGVNTLVNYRETGYVVMIENYGGVPMYQANNSNTKTYSYHSGIAEEFSDQFFFDVYRDSTIDVQQRNSILKEAATEFIKENPVFVVRNAAVRFRNLFISPYGYHFWTLFLALAVFWWRKRITTVQTLLLFAGFIAVTVIPPFGLFILRYSIPCIPFYALLNGSMLCYIALQAWELILHGRKAQRR